KPMSPIVSLSRPAASSRESAGEGAVGPPADRRRPRLRPPGMGGLPVPHASAHPRVVHLLPRRLQLARQASPHQEWAARGGQRRGRDPAVVGQLARRQRRYPDRRGPLPACRTVRTGSGGRHFYFAHPGFDVPNDTGRRLGPGIDIRGDGGYVIAPPSLHVSGGRYAVAAHGGQIVPPPGWLAELLKRPEPEPHPTRTRAAVSVEHGDAWARAAMHGELQRLHDATPGIRNSTLNRVSFRLGQIIGAGLLDHREIEQSLIQAGVSVGLGEREVARTVESGLTAGMEAPRGPVERVDLEIDGGPSLG